MKKIFFYTAQITLLLSLQKLAAQTLYVPGSTGVSTTGGVGIATPSPRGQLELFPICSSNGVTPTLLISKPGNLACGITKSLGNYIEAREYNGTNSTFSMPFVVTTVGRIGINMATPTTTPAERFHLHAGAMRITGNNPSGGPMILFGGTPGNNADAPTGQWGLEYTPTGMNFWRPNLAHNGSGTPTITTNSVLFLTNSNQVAVNTSTPLGMFHVENNVGHWVGTTAYFSSSANQGDFSNGIFYKYNGTASWHRAIAINDSYGNDVFTVHSNGYTTIGSMATLPGLGGSNANLKYKLIVEKGILTERVKVAVEGTADWSDYVFDPCYELKPVEEVADYINENKHLPGMPSVDEMIKNGNDLGKSDALLLKQIEELWLHMIQLSEENKALKSKLDALTK